jgi:hypothetical protein
MDHVVYLDFKAKEMVSFLEGTKKMVIRGATGRKLPYGRVNEGDVLYFINNNAEGVIKSKGIVDFVLNSVKMTKDESIALVEQYQSELTLTNVQIKRWAGKRYLVLIRVKDVTSVEPFEIDKSDYGNMDDWLLVEDIERVRVS